MASTGTLYRGFVLPGGSRLIREDNTGTTEIVGGTAFEWGVDSEAAGLLAFALLKDAFGEATADALWTDLKFDVVIDLDSDWVLTADELSAWLDTYSEE